MNEKYFETNKKRWDEMSGIHAKSEYYGLEEFKQSHNSLYGTEQKELGDISGKSLLHLMCHFGMDSLSLAKKGAIVTGLDFSGKMIERARNLSKELGISAKFVQGNVFDAPELISEKFDVVYATYGILCWLPDLTELFKVVFDMLKQGGFFYLADIHPVGMTIDYNYKEGFLAIDPYFAEKRAYKIDDDRTYTDTENKIQNTVSYEWVHTISDIINGVVTSGLKIDFFHEFPYGVFQMHPKMERREDKHWYFSDPSKFTMPMMFSLKTTK